MSSSKNEFLPFGVSQFSTYPLSFEEDLALYTSCGVDRVEICEAKMDVSAPEPQIEALLAGGFRVESIQPRLHSVFPLNSQPDPADTRSRLAAFRKTMETFAPFFPNVPFVTVTGVAPAGNFKEAYATAGRCYRELALIAAGNGVRIALEPLNPVLMNVDTFICTLAHAFRLIEVADHPSFGLCLDVWHLWEDASARLRLKGLGDRIFVVHINDWATPRSLNDRHIPGEGVIPLHNWVQSIRASGFGGTFLLEIFSDLSLPDSLWKEPRKTVVTARDNFERLWRLTLAENTPASQIFPIP